MHFVVRGKNKMIPDTNLWFDLFAAFQTQSASQLHLSIFVCKGAAHNLKNIKSKTKYKHL